MVPYDSKFQFQINVIRQKEPALWKARNYGIKNANSEYIFFLDDDSKITSDWLIEHLKSLDYFNADISSGVSISRVGAKVPENYSFFRLSDQMDTGNVLIKKQVFIKCGLFDLQFEKMRMGDGEFGVRAYLNGFINISNPISYREHLKLSTGGLRSMGHWDAFHTKNIFSMRPVPSVFYYWRKYWGSKAAIYLSLIRIPFTLLPYRYKSKHPSLLISCILSLLLSPVIIIQVFCSWKKSTKMLNNGPLIEEFIL